MQDRPNSDGSRMRWGYTEGLEALGQHEFAVPMPWPLDDKRDHGVAQLLMFLKEYIEVQPKRIHPGETMRYGWTLLRFRAGEEVDAEAAARKLVIEELEDPLHESEPSYVAGAARAIQLVAIQNQAIQRNRITGDTDHPYRGSRAMVCSRLGPDFAWPLPLVAHRLWEPEINDSGWFLHCCDRGHDHDNPDELHMVHLVHLVEAFPRLFPYLALPIGMAIAFEEGKTFVGSPSQNMALKDEAPPFDGTLTI